MLPLLTGLVAGFAHVVMGPDHLVAVSPMSADRPRSALKLGLRWGFGHGLGVIAMGILGLFLRDTLNLEQVSAIAEVVVGIALILTGFWAIRRSTGLVVHEHQHDHLHASHTHAHLHFPYDERGHADAHVSHEHAASTIGLLHGIAGSGHFWGLLPALSLTMLDAVFYLSAFVLGSTLTMAAVSFGIGRLLRDRTAKALTNALRITGGLAVSIGGCWLAYALS